MSKAEETEQSEENIRKIEFNDKLLKHLSLNESEINILASFGFTSTLSVLFKISTMVENEGRNRTAGKINTYTFDAYYNLIDAEFYGRTSTYFVLGIGNQLPFELINAFTSARTGLENLEEILHYPEEELVTDKLNQKQLVQLFTALSHAEIFTESSTVLAKSLAMIAPYELKSIKRVVVESKSTKGGHSKESKEAIINELTKIINDF
jgi:hypothetical protein